MIFCLKKQEGKQYIIILPMVNLVSRQFTIPFVKKVKEAKNTWTFYFDRTPIKNLYDFFPGQYNRITLPIEVLDGRGSSRQFTISSSPTEKDFLTVTTKISGKRSDFKSALFNLDPGTLVNFFGPLGGFYLKKEIKVGRVFLSGGIGITPFRSMVKYIADNNLTMRIILIASFSRVEEIVFYKELMDISKSKSNIDVVYTVSRTESRNDWQGETGRISESLIKKYVPDIHLREFMVVGPPIMVDDSVELLKKMGVLEEKIKAEHFTGYSN